ncbi:PucR family transcriptional regulator [Cryobacterium psychrophilum]|uniref:PucR family transcriptional regulator n=1 Tax=Cryobacterium psychrophilum TaxID=41988 RepID=A0A4Y8KP76_9MICO|nr:helix-turn-helix domain-containing protein [Cryobacterium psychrophilum]TDW30068.1 PucR-like helix-turn-helix protein [Cryobacterium psychrophilum]TFD76006.1 PucR family transcriptional regulator [Cryobacterium psychrophilum]
MNTLAGPQNVESAKEGANRWSALLAKLSVDDLTDHFLNRVLRVPGYDILPLPSSEIRRTGAASFAALIRGLHQGNEGSSGRAERLAIATHVGVSRARAGIPIESLMTAIRLDFSILWGELTSIADDADAGLLVRHTDRVWDMVDSYASQTQTTYMAERERMHNEESSVRQGYVAALFGEMRPPAEMLSHIADELRIAETAPLCVALAIGKEMAGLRVVVASAAQRDAEIFTHHLGDGLVAFWPCDERPGSAVQEAASQISNLRLGLLKAVQGIADLPDAARLARELAHLLTPEDSEALTMPVAWARIARLRLAASGSPITADVDAALARCGVGERARLIEGVRVYLSSGSIAASAEALFCHRNTLMNRLRRFADVTGVDVTVPQQAARLVVAWA